MSSAGPRLPRPTRPTSTGAAPRPRGLLRGRTLLAVALLVLVGATGFCGALAARLLSGLGTTPTQVAQMISHPGASTFREKRRLNILCLGVDYNHDRRGMLYTKYARTDTLFVVSVDREGQNLNVVSIPRDTWVDIPGHGFDKINCAYSLKAEGDLNRSVACVESLLGVRIDHTIVIKPHAAERLVDAIGGVDVVIDHNMDYDDSWGNLHIHLKKGPAHLNGKQAVGFIRFRKDAEGDRGRMRRQQQFIAAVVRQAARLDNLAHLERIAAAVRQNVSSSLDMQQMIDLALLYRQFDRKKMKTARIDGEDAVLMGVCCIQPDKASVQRMVSSLLADLAPPASASATPTAVALKLQILNGSGQEGAAGRLRDELEREGWTIVAVGDAEPQSHSEVRDHRARVQSSGQLPQRLGRARIVQDPQSGVDADCTVILGEDWTQQPQQP